MFQFYLSSIKREVPFIAINPVACFNSTLVQLKEYPTNRLQKTENRFNSTLVQLKAGFLIISLLHLPRFNSTLVQLKAFH